MIDWRSIETAPKNGDDLLVHYEFGGVSIIHIAWWNNDDHDLWAQQGHKSKDEAIGWWSYVENSMTQHKLEGPHTPTHWAPLNLPVW